VADWGGRGEKEGDFFKLLSRITGIERMHICLKERSRLRRKKKTGPARKKPACFQDKAQKKERERYTSP